MVAASDAWTWTVVERFALTGRGVVVQGEHVGIRPTIGQLVVVRDGENTVTAAVGALICFRRRDDAKFAGDSWDLLLSDVTLSDVPIGCVVTPETSDPSSA